MSSSRGNYSNSGEPRGNIWSGGSRGGGTGGILNFLSFFFWLTDFCHQASRGNFSRSDNDENRTRGRYVLVLTITSVKIRHVYLPLIFYFQWSISRQLPKYIFKYVYHYWLWIFLINLSHLGRGSAGGGGGYGFRRNQEQTNNDEEVEIMKDVIFIQNLPKDITHDDIHEAFSTVGPIKVNHWSIYLFCFLLKIWKNYFISL